MFSALLNTPPCYIISWIAFSPPDISKKKESVYEPSLCSVMSNFLSDKHFSHLSFCLFLNRLHVISYLQPLKGNAENLRSSQTPTTENWIFSGDKNSLIWQPLLSLESLFPLCFVLKVQLVGQMTVVSFSQKRRAEDRWGIWYEFCQLTRWI